MSQSSIAECNAALDARNAKLNTGTVEYEQVQQQISIALRQVQYW